MFEVFLLFILFVLSIQVIGMGIRTVRKSNEEWKKIANEADFTVYVESRKAKSDLKRVQDAITTSTRLALKKLEEERRERERNKLVIEIK